ncbi:alpha-ketoacid dehydrogenase subunit beta [Amycolatopsis alkalitolerans]|uniref:Alpha-ketoacid dehydrogenase subunit beta n=2 Tax=Amycolatopsis alkalitolerans TaxID=2547244 RepID=A0A5C4M7M4_9PSEU|nr:alpha-ketoacid dehydrogenase subunit beta [Amycolatopsis alkalitolerans]
MNCQQAVRSAMGLALEADPRVLVLGEDVADPPGGVIGTTKGLSTRFGPNRVRATPIAEQAIIGAAIGASLAGYRPIAEIMFCDFLAVCADQIANHAAKLRYMSGGETNVPITITTFVAGGRFGAQHTQSLEAWFMHTPGMKVVMPSNPMDAKGLLASCIADDDPCLFVQPLALMFAPKQEVPVGEYAVPLGKASVVRQGNDVTIVSYGVQVPQALAAAEELKAEGVSAEVIDLRSLVPLDMPTVLESVARTRRVVITHGATEFCGPGAEIATQIYDELFGELAAPVARVAAPYAPMPFAPDMSYLPMGADIASSARALFAK